MRYYNDRAKNYLKAVTFGTPDYIPVLFVINDACWHHYEQEQLFDLMEAHPYLFPGFRRPAGKYEPSFSPVARKEQPFYDDFGCLWQTTDDGITGTVTKHPLEDLDCLDAYEFPDPNRVMGLGPIDWEAEKRQIGLRKKNGDFIRAGLRHGHTFLQLCDIRGYQNLIFDMADEEPRLLSLIERLEEFNLAIIRRYLEIGVDEIGIPEDLGMQTGPMISAEYFEKYCLPSYRRMVSEARQAGAMVHMHSDGDIRTLADMLVQSGVGTINLQDLVNGVDWIAAKYRGKVCVDLDIDRQQVTPFGSAKDIDGLIRSEIAAIATRQGGLVLTYGLYPGIPVENIRALMDALEKYAFYFA